MGRLKNVLGTLLANKNEQDFLGEWTLEADGKYRSRWVAAITTSWTDPVVSGNIRVFVVLSPEYYNANYRGMVFKANRALAVRNAALKISEYVQKVTPKFRGFKNYASNDTVRYVFTDLPAAEAFVEYITTSIDPEAICYVEHQKSGLEDAIDLNIVGKIVPFKDQDLVGRYYIANNTIHVAFRYSGQRRVSPDGVPYYEHREEFFRYFSIDDYGTADERISDAVVLDDPPARDTKDVDRILHDAFGHEAHAMRIFKARDRAYAGVLKDFVHPSKSFITARFGAKALNTSEKEAQKQADRFTIKMISEETGLSEAEVLERSPFLREFLKNNKPEAPPHQRTLRRKLTNQEPLVVLTKPGRK